MKYKAHEIYHVFNQGNNKQPIFFKKSNYYYFLRKIQTHLLPYVDILAYCLMPNHFHLLIRLKKEGAELSYKIKPGRKKNEQQSGEALQQNLSVALAIVLRSYTRGINIQENRSGSLFRNKTKIKAELNEELIHVGLKNHLDFVNLDNPYAVTCFHYIHQNPVVANIVKQDIDWIYSSAREYANIRKHSICNKKLAQTLSII